MVTVLFALAACSGEGVDLQITSDVEIDEVELFIVYKHAYDGDQVRMAGVGWSAQSSARGNVYLMSSDELVNRTTKIENGTALLNLEAAYGYEEPAAIAFVGYRAGAAVAIHVLWGVRIPRSSRATWKVHLRAVDQNPPDVTSPPQDPAHDERAHVWRRRQSELVPDPSAFAACLAYQSWDKATAKWQTEFFVPDKDPDCDSQQVECDKYWYDRNVGSPIKLCLTDNSELDSGACVIGSNRCEDGVSSDPTCAPFPRLTCVPDAFCACPGGDGTCIDTALPSSTYFRCSFLPDATEGPCTGPAGRLSITIPGPACADVKLRAIGNPFAPSTMIELPVGSAMVSAYLGVYSPSVGCVVELYWQGSSAMNPGGVVLLDVAYGTTRNLIIPIQINFQPPNNACGNLLEVKPCIEHRAVGEKMFTCAQ